MYIRDKCRIVLVFNSCLSPPRPGSIPGPVHVSSVVDTVALELGSLTVLFVVRPLLHTRLHLNTHIKRRTRGKNDGYFQTEGYSFRYQVEMERNEPSHSFVLCLGCVGISL